MANRTRTCVAVSSKGALCCQLDEYVNAQTQTLVPQSHGVTHAKALSAVDAPVRRLQIRRSTMSHVLPSHAHLLKFTRIQP